ncbi:META domain-containing protein [Tabrizicola sp.]|uniref:META domain-containing protein n=1 Tax=Tabrizicola sp. TaxID=2005166 RepID=UPI001A3EE13A|nr:META domain-containing protein [Tabrizicola sp.]MBL9073125.1 META domain-containing protein [Tabrizicola sp.]
MALTVRPALAAALMTALALTPALAQPCSQSEPPRLTGADGGLEGGVSISVGRLADLIWVPLSINGQPVPGDAGLSLTVTFDGKVSGTTGCNRFTGSALMDAGVLTLDLLAITEMACVEPERMEREAAYLKALGEVRGFIVAPDGLWLTREDGTLAMCLW